MLSQSAESNARRISRRRSQNQNVIALVHRSKEGLSLGIKCHGAHVARVSFYAMAFHHQF